LKTIDFNRDYREIIPDVLLHRDTENVVEKMRELFPKAYFDKSWKKYPNTFGDKGKPMKFILLSFSQVTHDLIGEEIVDITEGDVLKIFNTKPPFTSIYLNTEEASALQKLVNTQIDLDKFAYRLDQKPSDKMVLTKKLEVLLLSAVKKTNRYNPKDVIPLIEDVITDEEKQTATDFLRWVYDLICLTPNTDSFRFDATNIHEIFEAFRKWTK